MKRLAIGVLAFSVILGCGIVGYMQWQSRAVAQEPYIADPPAPPQVYTSAANDMLHQFATPPVADVVPVETNQRLDTAFAQVSSIPVPQAASRFQSAVPSPPPVQALPRFEPNGERLPSAVSKFQSAVRSTVQQTGGFEPVAPPTPGFRDTSFPFPQDANPGSAAVSSFEPPADRKYVVHVYGGSVTTYPKIQSTLFLDGIQNTFMLPSLPGAGGDLKIYAESVEVTCSNGQYEIKCVGRVTVLSSGSLIEGKDLQYEDGKFKIAAPEISTSDTKIKSSDGTFSFDAQAVSVVKLEQPKQDVEPADEEPPTSPDALGLPFEPSEAAAAIPWQPESGEEEGSIDFPPTSPGTVTSPPPSPVGLAVPFE